MYTCVYNLKILYKNIRYKKIKLPKYLFNAYKIIVLKKPNCATIILVCLDNEKFQTLRIEAYKCTGGE